MHRGGTGEQACTALADGQPLSHGGQAFLDSAQCCLNALNLLVMRIDVEDSVEKIIMA